MEFDFSTKLEREGRDSLAVDYFSTMDDSVTLKEGYERLPMWVADMNFRVPEAVTRAIIERASHPAFGYFLPSNAYYDAIIEWQRTEHAVTGLTADCIAYHNGVLGGVLSALRVMAVTGDSILVHSPTYVGFQRALKTAGYNIVKSPLRLDASGVYRMDFADMEEKIKKQRIHAAIFCSPHNPTGRVWELDEMETMLDLFRRYDVQLVSDEIWSDLILPGYTHLPTQSVSEDARQRTVALYAPSKTFNLAGLTGSYHIVYNQRLREQVEKSAALSFYNSQNVLSMHALIGAYSQEGRTWLQSLREVLADNLYYGVDFIKERFPGVSVTRPQGTYMLFLDCEAYCVSKGISADTLYRRGLAVGVNWQDGRLFGGTHTIRMNLALPKQFVVEAFDRLAREVFV